MKERIIALWRMIAFLALVPVMSMILVACKPDEGGTIIPPVTPPAMTTHEAVDLGLSVKWASCNIGAESPEDLGGYYAWGETEEKTEYSWSTYRWYDTDNHKLTKYCSIDGMKALVPEDDVARVKWGDSWRTPTSDEIVELLNECVWEWTSVNGVNGYRVIGRNGNSIFLPVPGFCHGEDVFGSGGRGYYWSSTLDSYYDRAWYIDLSEEYCNWSSLLARSNGLSVRPVTDK